MKSRFAGVALLSLFIVSVYPLSSCKKKNCPADAEITILDSLTGKPLPGATVILHADTTSAKNGPLAAYLPDKKTTDASGKTYHEFPYEALLFIWVTKPPDQDTVKGYIRLERCEKAIKTLKY
jgi:hypothetical protein